MSVVVGFVIGGILVNLVIGTEGLIIAAVIALIVAGILYHVDDGIRNFVYYLIMPVMSIGIAGVAEIIWSSGQSHITFWIVYAAVILAVKDFLHPEAQYSTEHGVKGEEYDNVIFVISKGWNQYKFNYYFIDSFLLLIS